MRCIRVIKERGTPPFDLNNMMSLPENVLSLSASRRRWNGVSVEVTEWRGSGLVVHRFPREGETRLVTLLEEVGSACEPRFRADQPCPVSFTPRHMDFAPAGMEMWGYSADARFVRDALISFDLPALGERLATNWQAVANAPRLRFSDDRIWTLVKLLAEVVNDPDPSTQLYGDGLSAAIAARLLPDAPKTGTNGGGLAPWQLRRIVEYVEAHTSERIDLGQLATLAGLSQSHFSRAFRSSTGVAPYRWQLDLRIRRAQALLLDARFSLEQVAEATGFSDAVHFGRTFRKLVGATPAAWRRERTS
jgi:AraC family transcriptional regulator